MTALCYLYLLTCCCKDETFSSLQKRKKKYLLLTYLKVLLKEREIGLFFGEYLGC